MSLYAISLQPLITHLNLSSNSKQCWYADDTPGAGSLKELKKWWDGLNEIGPSMGYYPNAKKCWLVTKPEKENEAREIFSDTAINISTQGQKHLGIEALELTRTLLEEYVKGKVDDWVGQLLKLAEFAAVNPQASYAAFAIGLKHRWTYYLRTLPAIEELLEPPEHSIDDALIPMTGYTCTPAERELLALPVRLGKLGIANPCRNATKEYKASIRVSEPLVKQIQAQAHELPDDDEIRILQQCNRGENDKHLRERLENVKSALPDNTKRAAGLAAEKGASSWLTVIPLKDINFTLNKREFRDAVHLRYDWHIADTPSTCICGDTFTVDHAMLCGREGFIIQRHNKLRDLEADMLNIVCHDVQVEPVLQEITGEVLTRGTNQAPDARLDVHARAFWDWQGSAFFDVSLMA